jgi:hypothetical protein
MTASMFVADRAHGYGHVARLRGEIAEGAGEGEFVAGLARK